VQITQHRGCAKDTSYIKKNGCSYSYYFQISLLSIPDWM